MSAKHGVLAIKLYTPREVLRDTVLLCVHQGGLQIPHPKRHQPVADFVADLCSVLVPCRTENSQRQTGSSVRCRQSTHNGERSAVQYLEHKQLTDTMVTDLAMQKEQNSTMKFPLPKYIVSKVHHPFILCNKKKKKSTLMKDDSKGKIQKCEPIQGTPEWDYQCIRARVCS